uniref:PGG domain-containing protein n=1 Tax=Oryza glumipatula TaxID=40148 RepID=A0A0E0A882_9ORYZ
MAASELFTATECAPAHARVSLTQQPERTMDCSKRMSSETTRHQHDERSERNAWFKEMRGWLMVLATVAASVTPG